MTTVMLFYGHAASNWGDLAINVGATELLRRAGAQIEGSTAVLLSPSAAFHRRATISLKGLGTRVVPVDGTARGGREEIDVLAGYLAEPERFAEDVGMADHDVVVLNSGEHLFETASGENVADLLWRILPALAARAIGLPTIQLPVTIGPFHTRFGRLVEEFVLDGIDAVAFREAESRRLSTARSDHPLLPDPGFHVPGLRFPESPAKTADLLGIVLRPEDIGLRSGSRRSAFVQAKLRDSQYRQSRAFMVFAAVAEAHLSAGGRVRIVVQTRADREISQALFTHLTQRFGPDRVEFCDPRGFREFLTALGAVDAVVTSRFHAVILATAQGVPSAGVYSETHGHKMPGLFDMLRLPDGAVRVDDRDIAAVEADLNAALEVVTTSADEIRNRVKANRGAGRRWLSEALQQPASPRGDDSALRIHALAALYLTGLRQADDRALAEVRSSLDELRGRLDDAGDAQHDAADAPRPTEKSER